MNNKLLILAIIAGAIIVSGMVISLFVGNPIQVVTVDENVDVPSGSVADTVTGKVTYTVALNFDDGSRKVFTEQVAIPDLKLHDIFSKNKKITSIDLDADAKLNMPSSVGPDVGQTMYTDSAATLWLNNTKIATPSHADQFSLSQLGQPIKLYHFNIPADSITLANGKYALRLESRDQIRFTVAGQPRVATVAASPTFAFSDTDGVLKDINAFSYRPAIAISLSNDPVYFDRTGCVGVDANGTPINVPCHDLETYTWYINVKGTGFAKSAPVTIKYEEHSYANAVWKQPIYVPAQKTVQSDAQGTVTDRIKVANGISDPEPNIYGALVTISDGQNTVGPSQVGTLW